MKLTVGLVATFFERTVARYIDKLCSSPNHYRNGGAAFDLVAEACEYTFDVYALQLVKDLSNIWFGLAGDLMMKGHTSTWTPPVRQRPVWG